MVASSFYTSCLETARPEAGKKLGLTRSNFLTLQAIIGKRYAAQALDETSCAAERKSPISLMVQGSSIHGVPVITACTGFSKGAVYCIAPLELHSFGSLADEYIESTVDFIKRCSEKLSECK